MLDFSNHDVAIVKSTSKGLSDVSSPDVAIVKYNSKGLSDPQKLSGEFGFVLLRFDCRYHVFYSPSLFFFSTSSITF